MKQLSEQTGCSRVVDVGSGQVAQLLPDILHPHDTFKAASSQQGHLTRFLSFGLGLSVTAVEADPALVAMATKFDAQLARALEKEQQKTVSLFRFPSLLPAAD